MKHVKTLNKANLKETAAKGGCGECQASCQSACKTSLLTRNASTLNNCALDFVFKDRGRLAVFSHAVPIVLSVWRMGQDFLLKTGQ